MNIFNIDSVFDFGKYKGQSLKQIALIDPLYIEWCCKEVTKFNPSFDVIDQLSEYCLSHFFNDPEAYLNEKGNFGRKNWQYLKYKDKEIIIGKKNITSSISDKSKSTIQHIPFELSRAVFNGENCKEALSKRMETDEDDFDYNDDFDNFDYEELRRSNNDAYEIDSNEYDGWYEPID